MSKRFARREEAKEDGEEAKEIGTAEQVDKFSRRTVKVTREHNEECRRLLKLMGIPVIVVRLASFPLSIKSHLRKAPSEAEAQCAELARGGKVCLSYLIMGLCLDHTAGLCCWLRRHGHTHFLRTHTVPPSNIL